MAKDKMVTKKKGSVVPPTIDEKAPFEIAVAFRRNESGHGRYLRRWRGEWYSWNGSCYERRSKEQLSGVMWKFLAFCRTKIGDDTTKPVQPRKRMVDEVLEALGSQLLVDDNLEAPAWIGSNASADSEKFVTFQNGLLDLEKWLAGEDGWLDHSPDWFSLNCLPHSFEHDETYKGWEAFLEDIFDGDRERIACLQEWFGYNLTPDTSQQKLVMFVGPPRSGKGTVLRILQALIGDHNCVSPRLSQLRSQYALWGLVDKLAAICPDAHIGERADNMGILEIIKSITGEDSLEIQRKYLPSIPNARLMVRFTLAVNELPSFGDKTGSLRSRLIILPFLNSYVGKEDRGLTGKLKAELSGISNWALEGLKRLTEQGKFTMPTVSEHYLGDYMRMCSPVLAFLGDRCELGVDHETPKEELRIAWIEWCTINDLDPHDHDASWLSKALKALVPAFDTCKRGRKREQKPVYKGLRLAPGDSDSPVSGVSGT